MAILISGSLAYDYIMDFSGRFRDYIMPKNIHLLNVCFPIRELVKSRGGTAGNIAYTLKLLGSEPVIVSVLGKDGGEYLIHLRRLGIGTRYIAQDKSRFTASAHIVTDRDDNQVAAFFSGADPKLTPPIPRIARILRVPHAHTTTNKSGALAIISPSHPHTMRRHMRECAAHGIPAIFDPGQWSSSLTGAAFREMVRTSAITIGNDYEIKLLIERTGWSMRDVLKKTRVLITTFGEKGSAIATAKGVMRVAPAKPRRVTDPTGAGDSYRAGFLAGLERQYDLTTCGRMGSVAASFCIEHAGTQAHRFTKNEFRARFKKTYGAEVKI
ncbi:MAG: carbohydrate kinase family protein [Minisyncoccia bacterium]